MVSFLFVSTLLERKALKLSKWACTRVTEWEEIRSVVSTHYTCALSFPQHQIRSRMFPDQQFTLGSGAYTYMKQYRVFREVPLLFKFINLLSFFGNYFSRPMENKPYDDLFTFLQLLYIFSCLFKTPSYKATVTSNYANCLEQKNIFTWLESNLQEIFLVYRHGHHFVLHMAAMKSCENDR